MTEYINAELAATCAALGCYNGHTYRLDTHCIDVIKDLIKYLKRDSEYHVVRHYLGRNKLLQTDLIKILIEYPDKVDLWDVLLRLLINLTSPLSLMYNNEVPTEKNVRNLYEQLNSFLYEYKVALTDDRIWSVVGYRLEVIFKKEQLDRTEDEELTVERILVFIRNVLQIPDDNLRKTDDDATIHDELLFALHSSGCVTLLLFIISNANEQQYHMQILEIITLMLREQNAGDLGALQRKRSTAEKEKDEAKLVALRQKEVQEKMDKMRKYVGSRHSRFAGSYVVKNMKAIGENQLICHRPFSTTEALEFDRQKSNIKRSKQKLIMPDAITERTSSFSVKLFLKEFCVEFLVGAYNPVMRYARSCISSASHDEASDASHYLWAVRFFMEFNRYYKFEIRYVSETISTEMFYLVQKHMDQYYEMMNVDKKRTYLWSQRLHIALKTYLELLNTLLAMDKSSDEGVRESSKIIKNNIFYVPEYRETVVSQLLCYNEQKMSRAYLTDLIKTVHVFLKMLEQFCNQKRVVVQKVKSGRRRQKKKGSAKEPVSLPSLEEQWDFTGPELSVAIQQGVIPEVIPFDATLDVPIDEQTSDAMKKIQKLLRSRKLEEAVGLLRSARDVWPENECFGRRDIPPEEEFLALREIFFADLGLQEDFNTIGQSERNADDPFSEDDELIQDDNVEEEEGVREPTVVETDFKFKEFVQRFANMRAVRAVTFLLQQFDSNTPETNHFIVKLLHRIAWDCKMPGMICQASIFRAFQKILKSTNAEHKELQKFAVFIIRRFIEVAQKNPKAYMELFFWKSTKDATEMVDGYQEQGQSEKVSRALWSEVEEDELRTLFMEHQTNKYPRDLIDWLLENLNNKDRTRRGVIKKLKELCLIVNSKAVRKEVQKRLPAEWSTDEIAELSELWEQAKEEIDPIESIHDGLTIKRPKVKIKDKLLELGFAQDRKELRKKRVKKSSTKASWETKSASESEEDDNSNESDTSSGHRASGSSQREPSQQGAKRRSKKPMVTSSTKVKPKYTIMYTDAQLSGLLTEVIDGSMQSALNWLKDSLEDALEDRDEESIEGIPLVPITDEESTAIDSPIFQRLLRALGMNAPNFQEEMYWRIPAEMLTSTIRKHCDLIANALDGKFVTEETPSTPYDQNSTGNVSDGGNDLENVKALFSSELQEINDESKRSRSGDSDTELPATKKSRFIDSDEENSKDMSNTSTVKNRRIVISDDEDWPRNQTKKLSWIYRQKKKAGKIVKNDTNEDNNVQIQNKKARIIVRNIPFTATEEDVKKLYKEYGELEEVNLLRHPNGRLVGCGFVQFKRVEEASRAIYNTNKKNFLGRPISVDWSIPKDKFLQKNEIKDEENFAVTEDVEETANDASTVKTTDIQKEESVKEDLQIVKKKDRGTRDRKKSKRRARLIIRNLSFEMTEDILKLQFAKYGNIKDVKILTRPDGKHIGCGFVEFERVQSAAQALHYENLQPLFGRPIVVDWAVSKTKYSADVKQEPTENDVKTEIKEEEETQDLSKEWNDNEENEELNKSCGENLSSSGEEENDIDDCMSKTEMVDQDESDESMKNENISDASEDNIEEKKEEEEEVGVEEEEEITEAPRKKSNDVIEGRTVFIKNVPFSAKDDDLRRCMEQFGPVNYALICMDPLTEHSKGTAFVKFQNVEDAEKCLLAGTELRLHDQILDPYRALPRNEIQEKKSLKERRIKDTRNLYLVKEGVILAGSPAAEGVSATDMARRLQMEQWKSQMLRNLNMFVSRIRLVIHNLPPTLDDAKLRQLLKNHSSPKAVITEARVMRDMKNVDENGVGKSKEYGFVTFTSHEDALKALRSINNNPNVFGKHKRPIVAFSIENRVMVNAKQKRVEKSRERNPNWPGNVSKKAKIESKKRSDGKSYVGLTSKPGEIKMRSKFRRKEQALLHKETLKKERKKTKVVKRMQERRKEEREARRTVKPKRGFKKADPNEVNFTKLVSKYKSQLNAVPQTKSKWHVAPRDHPRLFGEDKHPPDAEDLGDPRQGNRTRGDVPNSSLRRDSRTEADPALGKHLEIHPIHRGLQNRGGGQGVETSVRSVRGRRKNRRSPGKTGHGLRL
ncbi:protein timeless homolog [Orussus abietinus]|uniref:protein timeless homolog n=1 Tax=Orussus abietinus TaxID=222816 RepID=UPI000624F426|nr:protein timeless homolog [Orussus abietinus]